MINTKTVLRGRPRKLEQDKAKPRDRIICDICGGSFTRTNRTRHNNTKLHKAYEKMNKTVRKILLNEEDEKDINKQNIRDVHQNDLKKRLKNFDEPKQKNIRNVHQNDLKKRLKNFDEPKQQNISPESFSSSSSENDELFINNSMKEGIEIKIPPQIVYYITKKFGRTIIPYEMIPHLINPNISDLDKFKMIDNLVLTRNQWKQ